MPSAIKDVRLGRQGDYLLPFFWLHGADDKTLRGMIGKIHDVNIRQVCVESRRHPDFCGPKWWRDMDVILDEAQKRGMRIWVLDDRQFPSGFAGGLIADKYPQHRRRFLNYVAIDALGPDEHASFLIDSLIRHPQTEKIEAVIAARRRDDGAEWQTACSDLCGELMDLTDLVREGRLYWSVPDGLYSIFVAYSYLDDGLALLNPISRDAVAIQIEGCYQPHFDHYGHLFGSTFAGFFSDEPQFANGDWNSVMGTDMPLPWSEELKQALIDRFGNFVRSLFPCLWLDGAARTQEVRCAYMDELSRLYGECFCTSLADWCHEHGVMYIGHQVEDNNSHSRLGSGTGHFFRGQCAQDMAGVDIVMHQIHPGYDQVSRHWHSKHTLTDGEFFHYGLVKLASSLAHIDPQKKGRALCENYGAYGWMEGLRLMKWLTDHCLVRGINRFIPHAFTDSAFPEWDSPPHFYAQGNNPQYRFMGAFFQYVNRMCHLLSGGRHVADVLVLYHAEAEWWGDAMLSQKPMRELMRRQIDFDVVPCDAFSEQACYEGGCVLMGEERYRALVIPAAEALPACFLEQLGRMRSAGVPVFFVERKPALTTDGREAAKMGGEVVALNALADRLIDAGLAELRITPICLRLRTYHYVNGEEHLFMIFNEEPRSAVFFAIELPVDGPYCRFDVMDNCLYRLKADGRALKLRLEPYESTILVAGGGWEGEALKQFGESGRRPIQAKWRVSIADAKQYPHFKRYEEDAALSDINAPEKLPGFSGTIRYETEFNAGKAGPAHIRLTGVYETAEIWVNGIHAGLRISAPYRFDVSGAIRPGKNRLAIEVTNTLVKQVADYSSAIVPQEPGGLLKAPELILLEEIDQ